MTTAEYTTLEIVGEEQTINLLDDVNYMLVSWAPAVPARERSLLGNYSPYANVEETIVVNVYGTTATEALQALEDLAGVLEQADAWSLGEDTPPVLLRVQILGSELDEPIEAVILGSSGDGRSVLRLRPTFNQDLSIFEIPEVELRFMRRGLWLGEEVSVSTTSDAQNPNVITLDMLEKEDRLCPTTVKITGFDSGTSMIGDGFLIVTGVRPTSTYGRNVGIYAAGDLTSDEFVVTDDAAHLAHQDDVQRIDASTDPAGTLTLTNLYAEVSRISIFAAVRNNSSTTSWRVRATSYGYATVSDRWRTIDASSQEPRIIYVGSVANQTNQHVNVDLEFETDAATGTLDVNYIVVVGHDQSTNYIAIEGVSYSTSSFGRALVVADRATTHRTPLLYIETEA